ncbi:MAG: carbohydrate kinase family protein [Candidatus Kerfeldbacteria bacterium]|nr:carbohydrate kinase family protein [Candidatus Kerfeldbacteria bacterium]
MPVLVSGSVAYDRIMDFPGKFSDNILPGKVHNISISFALDTLAIKFGGTAANVAYSLALLGEPAMVVASVGKDFADYAAWFKRHRLSLNGLHTVSNDLCATAHIITDKGDSQIAGFYFGGMRVPALKQAKVKQAFTAALKKTNTVGLIAAGNLDDMVLAAQYYRKAKVPFVFDPGQQTPWLSAEQFKSILNGAHTLIVNDYELALVQKKLKKDAKALRQLKQLIVTRGEKGADWYVSGKKHTMPVAKPKKVVDPTGAGDAYRSGVVLGLLRNWPIEQSGRVGALAATYAIEQYGTQQHSFSQAQFKKRYQQIFKHTLSI